MSRFFDDGASEYLLYSSAIVSGAPYTVACWAAKDDVDISCIAIALAQNGTFGAYLRSSSNGTIRFYSNPGSANTTTASDDTEWHHLCGIEYAANSRAVFLDGGGKATDATASTPTLVNTTIGASFHPGIPSVNNPFSGAIAEAVILRIAATDYQVWLHAQGVPAPIVWPGWAIAAYYPLFEVDRDFPLGRYNMTPFNTPSWAPHPPKVLAWWRKYMRGGTA